MHHQSYRSVEKPNAWVADWSDENASIELEWEKNETISSILLHTDTDYDHAMETIQWGHFDDRMPFCVDAVKIYDDKRNLVGEITNNYQTQIKIDFQQPVDTRKLVIKLSNSTPNVPVSLFSISIQ